MLAHVFPARLLFLVVFVSVLTTVTSGCSEDRSRGQSPTGPAPMTSRISGTLIQASPSGPNAAASQEPLAGVTVTLTPSGRTTRTDVSGGFVFDGVPAGIVTLRFDGPGVHAGLSLTVAANATSPVRVVVSHNTATLAPRGDENRNEIEGAVTSVDAAGGSLMVADERLGAVVVKTTPTTILRRGDALLKLADIVPGARVHARGSRQADGSFLAVEIQVKDAAPAEREVVGTIDSIDPASQSLVIQPGNVKVVTDGSTTIRKSGPIAFSALAVGDRVEVEGALAPDGSILARRIEVEHRDASSPTPTPTPGGPTATPTPKRVEAEARGTIQSIDASTQSFVLITSKGPVTVQTNASTEFHGDHDSHGSFSDLMIGQAVEVEGLRQTDGSILAREVRVED
jgi:hypothetical protein